MGVLDGQPVSAGVTNPAFINKNQNDTMPNTLGFTNPSTPSIADIQATANKLYTATGASETLPGTNYNATPATIANGDNYQTALNKLAGKFAPATGHGHTGAQGDGPILSTAAISNSPVTPSPVASANIVGSSGAFAWQNHQHQGVHSMAVTGGPQLFGDVVLIAGSGIALTAATGTESVTITSTAAGGGGGSLQWIENANAPVPTVENNVRVYLFQSGLAQALYALIKVPTGYAVGNPIKLKTDLYSPDNTGTALIQSVSTLIRQGTDAMSSTTNQRTSTNAAVTLGVGTVNIPQGLTLDLTDSSGNINGVAVNPGDLVLVDLTRGSDSALSDVRVPVYGAEVTFA